MVKETGKAETLKQAVEHRLGRTISDAEYKAACSQAVATGTRHPGPGLIAKQVGGET